MSTNLVQQKKKNVVISLGIILFLFFLAFFIRIYKIDSAPNGVFIDEASIGYNAFSILKTGKDEHGISFPLTFKAFGDQKLPAYVYLQVPFIHFFGLNNLSVRFPSALAGSLLVVIMYLLVLKLGFSKKSALVAGIIVTISPWSFLLSRFAYESNIALLFFSIALYLYPMKKNSLTLLSIISGLFFALTLYSYVAYKLATILVLGTLSLLTFRFSLKQCILVLLAFTFFSLPLVPTFFSQESRARLIQLQHNETQGVIMKTNEDRSFCAQTFPTYVCYLNSNKPLTYTASYVYRFIQVFSPTYLFFTGDKETHQNVENYGSFFVILIPFYILGCVSLFSKLFKNALSRTEKIILICLLITPLASILAGNPHKLRLTPLFPFILLLFTVGFESMISLIKSRRSITSVLILSLLINGSFFFITFLSIQVEKYDYLYGSFIPKLSTVLHKQKKDTQIYVQSISEMITYYAYYNSYNPTQFQRQAKWEKSDVIGFSHVTNLDNIHITQKDLYALSCEAKKNNTLDLFVTNQYEEKNAFAINQVIKSRNKVHSFAYIYNLDKIQWELCK